MASWLLRPQKYISGMLRSLADLIFPSRSFIYKEHLPTRTVFVLGAYLALSVYLPPIGSTMESHKHADGHLICAAVSMDATEDPYHVSIPVHFFQAEYLIALLPGGRDVESVDDTVYELCIGDSNKPQLYQTHALRAIDVQISQGLCLANK